MNGNYAIRVYFKSSGKTDWKYIEHLAKMIDHLGLGLKWGGAIQNNLGEVIEQVKDSFKHESLQPNYLIFYNGQFYLDNSPPAPIGVSTTTRLWKSENASDVTFDLVFTGNDFVRAIKEHVTGVKQTTNKPQTDSSRWNTKCHCGANAYNSGFSIECERGCYE